MMSRARWQNVLIVLALLVLVSPAAAAQEQDTASPRATDSKKTKAAKPVVQLPLRSVTLVSTDEAARNAAEEVRARAQSSKTSPDKTKQADVGKAADGAVLEFHPADGLPGRSAVKRGIQQEGRSKSVLKNIHGNAYGTAASAAGRARGEGGEVGADSRDGKINIYVEGERNHASTPVPH
ncbi:MAG TPA: hypothetical protein VFZ27_12525 [Terriglobia bacterium]|nr:hypothetical protein [Terriglobia bacterium]